MMNSVMDLDIYNRGALLLISSLIYIFKKKIKKEEEII